ncbi:MAG: ABC transporter C-terminal domain-containing protein, partial [Acidobacteriota bacterium]|nr:ABC transporter C-terminal domain-containing protein [Acidobacteriota bacterium]
GVKVIKKKKVDARTPENLEADIARAETKLKEISQQMGAPEIARDATRLIQLNNEYQETETRLQSLYAEWDRVSAGTPKV